MKQSTRTIIISLMAIFFSLSVSLSFISQQKLQEVSINYQQQNKKMLVYIDQQNNMIVWDRICKGEDCQSMYERQKILDDLSARLYSGLNENSAEADKLRGWSNFFSGGSWAMFFIGIIFFLISVIPSNENLPRQTAENN